MAHTPGNWVIKGRSTQGPLYGMIPIWDHSDDDKSQTVALVCSTDNANDDAKLIAAGPDLLTALRLVLDGARAGRFCDPDGEECGCDEQGAEFVPYTLEEQNEWILTTAVRCKEAIDKAEGKL